MDNCLLTIGREGQITLPDRTVSKLHAELRVSNGDIYLRDLNSTNGTYLVKKGRLVEIVEACVQPYQIIAFGNIQCRVLKLLQMAGASDDDNVDGTTCLGDGNRPFHLKHPRYNRSATDFPDIESKY